MEPSHPKLLATERLYEGARISLRSDTLRFEGRPTYVKDIIEHPGSAVILPIDDEERILFVKQWRPAAKKVMLELPSGTLEKGELPDFAAHRELREETGYRADYLKRVGGFWIAPGYSTEYAHLYHAKDLTPSPLKQDDRRRCPSSQNQGFSRC